MGRDLAVPKRVEALQGVNVVLLSGGWRHAVAADDQGRMYGWGWNKACTSSPPVFPSSSYPFLHLLCLFPLLSSSFSLSLFGPPPSFFLPFFFPLLFLLYLVLLPESYSSELHCQDVLIIACFALLLLLLLLVVVVKEADCMAGAETRSTLLLLCHCSSFRPACLISSSASSLSLVALHDAVAAIDNHG